MRARSMTLLLGLALASCSDGATSTTSTLGETSPVIATESPRLRLLPAASQDILRASRLPLMLPREPSLLVDAVVTAGPGFSALSAQGDGFSLSISGTDQRHELAEELAPPQLHDQVRGQRAIFTLNDGIRTVSWDEASVAWAVDVECFRAEEDPRCAGDDFVRAIAESLELVGGGP